MFASTSISRRAPPILGGVPSLIISITYTRIQVSPCSERGHWSLWCQPTRESKTGPRGRGVRRPGRELGTKPKKGGNGGVPKVLCWRDRTVTLTAKETQKANVSYTTVSETTRSNPWASPVSSPLVFPDQAVCESDTTPPEQWYLHRLLRHDAVSAR